MTIVGFSIQWDGVKGYAHKEGDGLWIDIHFHKLQLNRIKYQPAKNLDATLEPVNWFVVSKSSYKMTLPLYAFDIWILSILYQNLCESYQTETLYNSLSVALINML